MTSILPPTLHARFLASEAAGAIATARAVLTDDDAPAATGIGIPERSGPDSPDNPWFVSRPTIPEAVGATRAAVRLVDRAMGVGQAQLGSSVMAALADARSQALEGIRQLRPARGAVDLAGAADSLDRSARSLQLVRSLLDPAAARPATWHPAR